MFGSIQVSDPKFSEGPVDDIPIEYLEVLNMPFCMKAPDGVAGVGDYYEYVEKKYGSVDPADVDPFCYFSLPNTQLKNNDQLLIPEPAYYERELLIVNGAEFPTIDIEQNKWYRYRLLYASSFNKMYTAVWKSKFYGAFVLNHRVVLHAIDATPARWRGDAGSLPLDRARTAASSPRYGLVKNCRVHRAPDTLVDFHSESTQVHGHRRLHALARSEGLRVVFASA